MYRAIMKDSEGRLTPDVLCRMSIPQLAALSRPAAPAMSPARQLEVINRARAKRGLPPVKSRRVKET